MEVPGRRGQQPTVVDRDEGPLKFNQEKLQALRPAFSDGKAPGTVTPGNSSPVTDGAAALVLTSPAKAHQRGLTVSALESLCMCFSSAWQSQCIWVLLMGRSYCGIRAGHKGCPLESHHRPVPHGLQVLARIRGYGDAEREPDQFTTAPALAIPRALKAAGLTLADIDYFEINEAFSVVDLVNRKLLGLDAERCVLACCCMCTQPHLLHVMQGLLQ